MELKVAIFFGLPEQGEPCTVVQTLHSYILSLSCSERSDDEAVSKHFKKGSLAAMRGNPQRDWIHQVSKRSKVWGLLVN
ncbi:hypothetical protein LWI29_005601 [Acer saccharum]|uniref:Uncharacterized protein n=1 Tax=Acer saccharum TaxID=4024 RepID=A0AA39VW82_ACESA|nr:hypothetical protein LWI29_005601 [Acer saccharum]